MNIVLLKMKLCSWSVNIFDNDIIKTKTLNHFLFKKMKEYQNANNKKNIIYYMVF